MQSNSMNNEHNRPRILFLDGLRCIAILAVIPFHYFSRWTPPEYYENLYPYGNVFSPLFRYGFYGVNLFFVVSGFVITLTLYKCSSPFEFGVRRIARLWPSMALCSLITLLLIRIIPCDAAMRGSIIQGPSLMPTRAKHS